jgi:signal transduction histidine kinase
MSDNQLSFKIKAGLKNIIGRDLITDDYIAVFELVKNSFDAYAKKVTITFKEDKIIIADDGKGMDIDDINQKWLAVAYSAKKEGVEDEKLAGKEFDLYRDKIQAKKFFAGAKGIGRFSCDRLGNKLVLTSKKAASGAKIEQIEVDWSDFEKDSKEEFIDIKVKHRTLHPVTKALKKLEHGTILEIIQLNSLWDRPKKLNLKHSLEKLINPFEDNPLNGFSILISDEREVAEDNKKKAKWEKVNGEIKNFIFEDLNLKTTQILTEIDIDGKYITTSLTDRGILIYKMRRPNNTIPKFSNVNFNLFFLNRAAKKSFATQMGIPSVQFGSIFLYRNGFRIAPYGNPSDDSFGIDSRHAQGVWRTIGLRDLIGRIEIIGDQEKHFLETSSRDGGLVKNEYYHALLKCFDKHCLTKLENYLEKISWKNKADKDREDLSALDNIKSKSALLKLLSEEIEDEQVELLDADRENLSIRTQELLKEASSKDIKALKLIAKILNNNTFIKEAEKTSNEYEKILELQKKLIEEEASRHKAEEEKAKLADQLAIEIEKNTFLRATSRGLNDDAKGLVHNIKHTSKNINSSIDNLISKIKSNSYKEKDIFDKLQVIKFNNKKVLKIAEIITRANFKTDVNSQILDVVKYIVQYLEIYDEIFEKNKLKIKCFPNDSSFIKRLSALDISLILDDLISNSVKATAKNVKVDFKSNGPNELQILISDDGNGVPTKFVENPDAMFELGISQATVGGSGIGLYSVKKTLKPMNGLIEFVGNAIILKGATFKITITK